jgi:hypothetical protein
MKGHLEEAVLAATAGEEGLAHGGPFWYPSHAFRSIHELGPGA